jgi:histidyl-tRNA synthetase
VEQLGGKPVPAAGFAMGLERLLELVRDKLQPANLPHAYLVLVGDAAQQQGLILAEQLRNEVSELRLLAHCGGGSFKSQFKRADRSGAQVALILGEEEVATDSIGVKFLREDKEQEAMTQDALGTWLKGLLA